MSKFGKPPSDDEWSDSDDETNNIQKGDKKLVDNFDLNELKKGVDDIHRQKALSSYQTAVQASRSIDQSQGQNRGDMSYQPGLHSSQQVNTGVTKGSLTSEIEKPQLHDSQRPVVAPKVNMKDKMAMFNKPDESKPSFGYKKLGVENSRSGQMYKNPMKNSALQKPVVVEQRTDSISACEAPEKIEDAPLHKLVIAEETKSNQNSIPQQQIESLSVCETPEKIWPPVLVSVENPEINEITDAGDSQLGNKVEEPKTPLVEQNQSNAFESPPIPNEVPPPPPLENLDVSVTSNDGLCARAVYDYQADAEDEISFDPGEIITNIDQIDDGWWQGSCRGKTGLFPANYVELMNW